MSTRSRFAPRLDPFRSEIVKLAALIAITSAAFAGTRALSAGMTELRLADAAAWHARGQEARRAGRVQGAIEDFRRAAAMDRDNRTYGLALAGALARGDQPVAAERILLSLRGSAPEDPDINVELARLAANRDDVPTAVRYYQSALYAPPRVEDGPRRIRLELIQFLLQQGENDRALSELIAAAADVPDEPGARTDLARLTLRAGDATRALEQFQEALRLDASDADASAGAGTAAFRLGDFASAVRYLESAPDTPELADLLATADLVLTRDPLAPRLSSAERRRRLAANVAHVQTRLDECAAAPPVAQDSGLPATRQALVAIEKRLRPAQNIQDIVDDGVAAVYLAARFLAPRCGAPQPLDRALVIIAERHGVTEP